MTKLDRSFSEIAILMPNSLSNSAHGAPDFSDRSLLPAIAQQFDTGEVLMLAWMNREAFHETLATGRACYWSRSRQALWRKGETSGHIQRLIDCRVDCDNDTILLLVDQHGVACHTGQRSCFFRRATSDTSPSP